MEKRERKSYLKQKEEVFFIFEIKQKSLSDLEMKERKREKCKYVLTNSELINVSQLKKKIDEIIQKWINLNLTFIVISK